MRYLKGVPRCAVLGVLVVAGSTSTAQIKSELLVGGLTLPLAIVQDTTNSSVLFVVEQRSGNVGRIRVVQNGTLLATPFLSVSPVTTGSEQGLLGMALAPDYASSGFFYVCYTDLVGTTNFVNYVRYQRSATNPLVADPASASIILRFAHPFVNHNGGTLAFGPDNMLYIATGDGGSGNDPGNRAQNGFELMGKMLRIDPAGADFYPGDPNKNFAIPSGNPFIGSANFLPEIWAIGLRNPWKYSLDPISMLGHNSWLIADVGQNAIEEINYEFPGQSGRNYGWRVWEGTQSTGLTGLNSNLPTVTFPIYQYDHTIGASVIGGHVYRGVELGPELWGDYFYGDSVVSKIWSFDLNVDPVTQTASAVNNVDRSPELLPSSAVTTFGVDANGELLFNKFFAGQILRIRALNRVWMTEMAPFAARLLDGTLRHLVAADGNVARVTPAPDIDRGSTLNFRGGLFVAFKTDQLTTPNLNATIRLSTNQAVGGTARLLLRNWSTGNFDEVGSGAFGTSFTNVVINGIPAANYRRNADGRIEARIRGDVSVSNLANRTVVSFDQVWMTSN